jgi:NTE family protein
VDPKIGIALSGGGMRGLAHLGVLDVMQERGVPVDAIAGASMGGLIGGLYAAGIAFDDMVSLAQEIGMGDVISLDRSWRGVFDHRQFAKLLADLLGGEDLTFDQLRIPLAVTAVDVERGELVILDSGPLIPALMATSAVPVAFAPVRHQERWLVDGGVLNNLPVDVAWRMGVDRVLAVNVPSRIEMPTEPQRQSSWRWLARDGGWKLPFLIGEATTSITEKAINRRRLALCPPDLLIEIAMPNTGLFTGMDNAEIIEAGREAALARADELVALHEKPLPPPWRRRLDNARRRLRRAWEALNAPSHPLCPE